MKAVFEKKITLAEARELRNHVVSLPYHAVVDPYYNASAEAYIDFQAGCLKIMSTTSGGHKHLLEIFPEGLIRVSHDGARSSTPTLIWELIPQVFKKHSQIKNWELIKYETSQPDWSPVAGILTSRYWEDKPQNAQEADNWASWEKAQMAQAGLAKAGIKKEIVFDVSSGIYLELSGGELQPLKLSGVEYRRLAACGVQI